MHLKNGEFFDHEDMESLLGWRAHASLFIFYGFSYLFSSQTKREPARRGGRAGSLPPSAGLVYQPVSGHFVQVRYAGPLMGDFNQQMLIAEIGNEKQYPFSGSQ